MNEYILLFISLFVLSISLNIFLVWYARKASSRLTVVASNIDEIMTSLEDFENHLETIYEMETFYGDETLHGLIVHARGIAKFLSGFEDIYELSEELYDDDELEEEWEEPNDKEERDLFAGTGEKEKKKTTKKDVFHTST